MAYSLVGKRVFVAGHRGMVGSAVTRRLASEQCEILVAPKTELDLLDQRAVRDWMSLNRPHAVVLAAARVGGIIANLTFPADFIFENLQIETNIIGEAARQRVEKLVFLGSSCIYPKFAPQPIQEQSLLTGTLEPTNEPYAIAKIAGLKMCTAFRHQYGLDFISVMPSNLFGPGDNYNLETSHVISALIRKAHEAKEAGLPAFVVWGTGSPRREFLFVDDAADAIVHLLKYYSEPDHINVGSGSDITILDLAKLIADVVGFRAEIHTDPTKPDGTPQKLMDISRLLGTGWRPKYSLREGIEEAYRCYRAGLN
jgi:GDP-L-fucose synthase